MTENIQIISTHHQESKFRYVATSLKITKLTEIKLYTLNQSDHQSSVLKIDTHFLLILVTLSANYQLVRIVSGQLLPGLLG